MTLPDHPGYQDWLTNLKNLIRTTRTRAMIAANTELVMLYWQLGRDILERQEREGWGTKVIDQLAADLRQEFPEMKGLSRSNLMYMRAFASAWNSKEIVQQLVGQLPWGHNIQLLEKLSTANERQWYARAAIEHGWSRAVLVHQIDSRLHERQGATITNFEKTLPTPQSELAQQSFKDPYVFDFLTLSKEAVERDLEDGLTANLKDFLLEMGKGFAYVGRQYHLEVGGQDFYLDLLFYNTRLHCYVVIDLKIEDFQPEHVGKMQFYLAAVDAQLKTDRDDPTIGLILCRTRNGVIVEYTLRDSTKPIGVAEYRTLPPKLAEELPTVEQLEALARTEEASPPELPPE